MTSIQQRTEIVTMIESAVEAGARRQAACKQIGLSQRTLQRWKPKGGSNIVVDQRPTAKHPTPHNALSEEESVMV